MYAETVVMLPYFSSCPQEVKQFDDFCSSHKISASPGISISGYNVWGEGDLFKAPEPVIEEPVIGLDPMTAAMSMISCGEDAIQPQSLTVSDIESSIKSGQILSEVFYECRKDLLAKEGNEIPLSEVMSINLPNDDKKNMMIHNEMVMDSEGLFQKSVSSGCLPSMDNSNSAPVRPSFLDFPVMDFETVYGLRRAFSEGDIKTLGVGNANNNTNSIGIIEERREKLSRYRSKKSKRNFGRKIKYACRKALADSQPRIRGRFAKTEETGTLRR